MSEVFGSTYAAAYDLLYADKDYAAECALVLRLAGELLGAPPQRVLDLGSGTGGHAIELARRGLDVVGVDLSPAMLERAEAKAAAAGVELAFVTGDVRTVQVEGMFDLSLMMFAILSYQSTNADVVAALRTAATHTRPGGVLLFDVWYGPAVLSIRPGERVKSVRGDGVTVLRAASTDLDTAANSAIVHYRMWVMPDDGAPVEIEEDHRMRYFFPLELELLLDAAGLDLVRIGAFDAFERDPDETTWNVLVAGRVRG